MERTETAKLLMLISALYPNWKPQNIALTTEAWNVVLKDYSYHEIEKSLYDYSQNNKSGFAPSPGQLIVPVEEKKKAAELSEWERCLLSLPGNGITTISEERLEDKDGV